MFLRVCSFVFLLCMPIAALAQTKTAFLSGFSHPVMGFDHLLAMVSVGILSAQLGGKAIWTVPLTFVFVMLAGGVMGMMGIPLFSVELGISLSVLALGLALALDKKAPILIVMVFVGFFALFHGYAHGEEMPILLDPVIYASGFAIGTAAIHIAGVLIAVFAHKIRSGYAFLRYLGAGVAGIGVHLLVGL